MDVRWDNGRKSVLITNVPPELLDASEITKNYFDRWQMQEKQFRGAKSGVNIHRITGYEKKIENYDKMSEKLGCAVWGNNTTQIRTESSVNGDRSDRKAAYQFIPAGKNVS